MLSSPLMPRPRRPPSVCCGSVPFRASPLEPRSRCAGARFSSSGKSDASVELTTATKRKKKKEKGKGKRKGKEDGGDWRGATAMEALVKRRTRSSRELDDETVQQLLGVNSHIPVLLGEVLDVFSGRKLQSFADCTVGAAGHSSSVSMQIFLIIGAVCLICSFRAKLACVCIEVCGKIGTWGLSVLPSLLGENGEIEDVQRLNLKLLGSVLYMENGNLHVIKISILNFVCGFWTLCRTFCLCFVSFFAVSSLADREELKKTILGKGKTLGDGLNRNLFQKMMR